MSGATQLAVGAAIAAVAIGLLLAGRALFRDQARRSTLAALHRFRARLDRYKLVRRPHIKRALLADADIAAAVRAHAAAHGEPEAVVWRRVAGYLDEIVPAFNVLSYYRLGYNLSRALIHLLYRPTIAYEDVAALERIPRRDVVVYLMNHRSNADYVVVAFVLAQVVSISYAVGEWARTWPLEFLFKSFGSYFVRRGYREPLYHTVLARYVQLITRNGVTQGIFPEGGLTRDGALRPPKLGLLDSIVGTLRDPAFDADIWLVPVGINFDRVLEDRSLIRERLVGMRPMPRARQLVTVASYLGWNFLRLVTGRLRRYGRVAVSFGTPISVRGWLAAQEDDILSLPRDERMPRLQALAEHAMERIGAVIPVTPVPLAAAALLSFPGSVVRRDALLERMDELRDALREFNARIVRNELTITEVWDRAWRMLALRHLVLQQGEEYVILPHQRPLLEYYANSIRHLLPEDHCWALTPALERDPTLPRLSRRDELS